MSVVLNPVDGEPFSISSARGGVTTRCPLSSLAQCGTTVGAVTVQRPLGRVQGSVFAVVDLDGNAAVNAITVDGDGDLIDGEATLVSTTPSLPLVFLFDAGQWRSLVPIYRVDDVLLSVMRKAEARPDPRLPTVIASGSVAADGTLLGGVGFTSSKPAGPPGIGIALLTFPQGFADAAGALVATPHQLASGAQCVTSHVSDQVKQVETRVGGILTDTAFEVVVTLY